MFRRFLVSHFLLFASVCFSFGQERGEIHDSATASKKSLRDLASRLLQDGAQVGCIAQECKILVLNFAMPAGVSPVYGSQLADELSRNLADLQKEVQVFDRGLLKTYVAVANLPSDSPKSDEDAREFARGLGATAAVTGSAEKAPDNSLRLSVRLVGAKGSASAGPIEVPPAPADLPREVQGPSTMPSHTEPGPGARSSSAPSGSNPNNPALGNKKTAIVGTNGVSLPSCSYMPNPPYTKEARAAKFSGSVLVEGTVGVDGKITHVRILDSPGLGLDEVVRKTLEKWKCSPATGPNGKPVPVIVPFEINYRLY
jgi:TonB family protein